MRPMGERTTAFLVGLVAGVALTCATGAMRRAPKPERPTPTPKPLPVDDDEIMSLCEAAEWVAKQGSVH